MIIIITILLFLNNLRCFVCPGNVGESPGVSTGPMSNLLTKFKLAPPSPLPLEVNPIMEFFDVGKETSSAGPELVWKVHDALRKSDGKVRIIK